MHQSVRPSLVFLAIVAITAVGAVLAWLARGANYDRSPIIGVFVFVIAGWLVSLCLHEFAHAFTAWRFGDHDVPMRGYLTLNPFKYANPVLSLAVARALHPARRHRPARRRGLGSHVVHDEVAEDVGQPGRADDECGAAVVLLVLTKLLYDPHHVVFWAGIAFLGFLQVTAAVLNLLPIPGLDGYSALEPHLSPETQRALQPAKQWAFFIVLLLLIATPLNQYFWSLVRGSSRLSGIPDGLVGTGFHLTRFWSAWL